MSATPTPQEAMTFMYQAVVHQWIDLAGPWQGWRIRGRELVALDRQRITEQRLKGLLWRDEMELRRAGFVTRKQAENARRNAQLVKVVVVQLGDYLRGEYGIAAA